MDPSKIENFREVVELYCNVRDREKIIIDTSENRSTVYFGVNKHHFLDF